MDISCVLLTWNSERYIGKCLQTILTELDEERWQYEVFVIDNGSQDGTVSILNTFHAKYPEQLLPIYLEQNTGTTYSRNLALKRAKGKYICVIDSDVEISQGAIRRLIQTLEQHERVGLVAPKLLYPNGTMQKSTDVFPTIFTKLFRYFFLKLIEHQENKQAVEDIAQQNEVRHIDYAISAMWVFRKKVLEQVGLLDENIFYAPEDVDYCLRIWKSGYTIVYEQAVSCIHHTQEISRGFKINRPMFNHMKGLLYYFRKHHYIFSRPTFIHNH